VSYAQLSDVKARAGVIATAWSADTQPADADIERILQQVSGELDALLASKGYPLPILDQTALDALVSITADKALLLAIDATYPGGSSAISDLRANVLARVQAYDRAVADDNLPALLYLGETSLGAEEGGAADFWTVDGQNDYYWSLYAGRLGVWPWAMDAFGVAPTQSPAFRKGERL